MRLFLALLTLVATVLAVLALALPRVELAEAKARVRAELAERLAAFATRTPAAQGDGEPDRTELFAWAQGHGVDLAYVRDGRVVFATDGAAGAARRNIEDMALRTASDGPGSDAPRDGWARVSARREGEHLVAAGALRHGQGFVVLGLVEPTPRAAGPIARARALVGAGDAPVEVVGPLVAGLVVLLLGMLLARGPRGRAPAEPARPASAAAPSVPVAAQPQRPTMPVPAPALAPVAPPPTALPPTAASSPVPSPSPSPPVDWRLDESRRPAEASRPAPTELDESALPEVEPLLPGPPLPEPSLPEPAPFPALEAASRAPLHDDAPTLKTPALEPAELALRGLYDDFMAMRRACGEPTNGLDYSSFRETVRRNEAALRARHGCADVRLEVFENHGRAALRMVPG